MFSKRGDAMTSPTSKRKSAADEAVIATRAKRSLVDVAREPSTIAGVLTMVSQLILAGPGVLTNPGVWAGVLSGVGLILTKEAK